MSNGTRTDRDSPLESEVGTIQPSTARLRRRDGFALPAVILGLIVVSSLLVASFATTRMEVANVASTVNAATGFYSAEAGLNIRGEMVRQEFQGYNRPTGESPDTDDPCDGGNLGSGDFECMDFQFNSRDVTTYVVEDPKNNDPDDAERMITIPAGERFAGLNAVQYRYSVMSEAATIRDPRPESILEMVFRARLVPLFQFAAFYDKDLEILPGPDMTLAGPVHVNGDLYVNANSTLTIEGAITVSERIDGGGGTFWRGRKDRNECTGTVRVNDADVSTNPEPAVGCPRRLVPQTELNDWNGRIDTGLQAVTVPPPEEFAPGGLYWGEADLVVALDVRNGLDDAEVIVPDRGFTGGIDNITVNNTLTNLLDTCEGIADRTYEVNDDNPWLEDLDDLEPEWDSRAIEWSNSFRDRRENPSGNQRTSHRLMLEVDVEALLDCMHGENDLFDDGPSLEADLDDTSSGGLVWYFTVLGDDSEDDSSGYGVRLRNGERLDSGIFGAPDVRGLTVVSDQAVFIEGHYNRNGPGNATWRPASVMSDALNILSSNFLDTWDDQPDATNPSDLPAGYTEINAAFMSGTQTTGGVNGVAGQGGAYNGGLENYPIFHECWSGDTLEYLGSFVSLNEPSHNTGQWGDNFYCAPTRDWGYDTRFNDAQNLPPLSPRFVYLIQERFVRDFTR